MEKEQVIYQLVVPGPIEDVEELRVLEWHGDVNQEFLVDELIVELETHKAIVEVRAGQRGFLRQVLGEAGSWEKIGKPLALLSDASDEAIPASLDGVAPLLAAFEVM
ncbi:2-oxoglutarate dehydrogenase E2 component (dihydrolipoamide succinyltransferase) [Methylocapsa palsarum]|uniref:2-oxoglutarate dehydrogenase E2 component (Dihydrolipoamide succinyltransferase) n=2 Tax=Methylocapsa palsarum TaxID=1612308 RepID=A0A1I3YW87_9HYPH|nr:2-oxoglutarate dehydrogenase E2 component (dihydrolipoamide succinyltransferase) [Methylocapsa palsarum]